jgi:hypothetical protein
MENVNLNCPRCRAGQLRSWNDLDDEQREVVRRLPASADHSFDERKAGHRWCIRCWYEDTGKATLDT